jgi:hypothetical protein
LLGDDEEDVDEDDVEEKSEEDEDVDDTPADNIQDADQVDKEKSKVGEILEFIEQQGGEDRLFPPLDGTSFYALTCKINHSCDPNVIVTYSSTEEKGLQANLLVLRPIGEGEELVQSYIDQSQPLAARRVALLDYGFTCMCSKCMAESK